MLPIRLAFSPLYLGFHLSEVGDIFGTVDCSLSLEEIFALSLQYLDMFVDPWLMDLVSTELLLGDIKKYFSISSCILLLNLAHNVSMSSELDIFWN